jgi:hypothetical protein
MSSQVFEGVTEYLVSEQSSNTENTESQKGPIASGRLLADIMKSTSRTSEKKYLHDYSYTLFEQHLLKEEKVLVLNEGNIASIENINDSLQKHSFIKVKAKALFNDLKAIQSMLKVFNKIGSSLAVVANSEEFFEFKNNFQSQTGKNSKSKGFGGEPQASNDALKHVLLEFAKHKGLYQDPEYLESIQVVLDYGFHDQLELQLQVSNLVFSADLNRDYLRESDDSVIRKYSRRTEKEFIVFGTVTQSSVEEATSPENEDQPASMKIAVLNIANRLTDFELTFSRKATYEIIIDPIAVYTEL